MGRKSRNKGQVYEREIANLFKSYGFPDAKRTGHHQVHEGDDAPDVSGVPPWWIECKRRKRIGNLYDWMQQAKDACGVADIPVVICRADHRDSLVVLEIHDFLDLITKEEE